MSETQVISHGEWRRAGAFTLLFFLPGKEDACMADGSCEIQYETRIEPSCETLLMCIVAMLRDGVRSGGGIGDSIRRLSSTVS